ncbi:hypothetical protein NQ317_003777 [Molorchus minor]|uniref:Uncharacterized protein n=1 Tax=Molorchus minor TaxID=1323400 RepID=A0ABQ9JWD9_9CUCU|nr:hypothetical protein NQ317_003777 [Molorchus minor]
MYNSTTIGDFSRANNNSLHKTLNDTANGIPRSFLQPKITSTPLVRRDSVFATPPKPHIRSPRRYSLSEIATPPRTNKKDQIQPIGPLLASTRFNLNVSTYEDAKSPGLVSRIIQYNEEAEKRRTPTDAPVKKPRRVTVRIASPEYSRQHSLEYNRKLLEDIVKPNLLNHRGQLFSPSSERSISSTRSVLEALKEISRKRIHVNEEYEIREDSTKRLRTENTTDDSNKRPRNESPLSDSPSSPSKPGSKRVCMYDEYAASCSSTDFSFTKKSDKSVPKRKSISISTLTENPKESKQVKLINAETQTISVDIGNDVPTQSVEFDKHPQADKEQADGDKSDKQEESPVKVFDDAPLDRIRKNRLAALMGSLAGKDPVLSPKPDYLAKLDSNATEISKVTTDSNKHVHFSIPESSSQPNLAYNLTTSDNVATFAMTQSSTSIGSPISSASEAISSFVSNTNEEKQTSALPLPCIGQSPSHSGSVSSSATSIVSNESSNTLVALNPPKSVSVPNVLFSSTASLTSLNSTSSNVTFPALPGNISYSPTATPTVSTASPPKIGGFRFNLSKPASTTVASSVVTITPIATVTASGNVPTFSFGTTPQSSTNKTVAVLGSITSTPATSAIQPIAGPTAGGFSFGLKGTTAPSLSTTSTSSFSTGNVFGSANSPAPTFKFGSASENKPALEFGASTTSGVSFGTTTISSPTPSFGVGTSTTPAATGAIVPSFGMSKVPDFTFGASTAAGTGGFGAPATTAAPPAFGAPTAISTSNVFTSSMGGFGVPTTSTPASGFGITVTSSTTGGFGNTSTNSTGFGKPSITTGGGGFGSSTNPMFGSSKQVSPFGSTTTNNTNTFGTATTSMSSPFGVTITSTTTPMFGTSSTPTSSPFGKTPIPAFGQTVSQSPFGTPTTTVSFGTANSFGTTTTTTASVFGGVTNTTSGFGKPLSASSQPPGFGATASKPMFGAPVTSPFGPSIPATTAPAFGSSTTTPTFNFEAKTTANSTFGPGSVFGATTTAASGFGTSTIPSFGSTNSFGSNSSNFGSSNPFGSSAAPAFGAVTTTTQSTGFGTSNAAPAFGNGGSGFNTNTNKPAVFGGSATPAFAATPTPSFGASAPTTGFGATNNTSGFGTNTAASAFAKPQTGFGTTTNTFGPSSGFGTTQTPSSGFGVTNPPSSQTPVFSFGAANPSKPANVFQFGGVAGGDVPKPNFNFTGGNATPAFGNPGGAPPPAFGATAVPQFNAPQPAAGMFSIGSGSTGRTRTQLRAKRRT